MTVENCFTRETDTFVLKNAKYYPEKIPILHWQLRHFISNPETDLLYYAVHRDVYSLNTATRVRTYITCLPFWARCTASGWGYFCAGGGEGGHFAIVDIGGSDTIETDSILHYTPRQTRQPTVQVEKAGSEIVNSISIHKLEGDEELGILDDVVAVLTNNDKSVRIWSLTRQVQTVLIEMPFPINHATLSPDGQILVIVGDYQQAYFYQRIDQSPPSDAKLINHVTSHCTWDLLNIVNLHVPQSVHATGYFSTAWSPSGNLCAVGSECGYVSVIDMEAMQVMEDTEDAIVVVMPSSRPEAVHSNGAIPGAIRTMVFSPHPWDFLIWAEDQGRICLADLREGLRVKQTLRLDPNQEGIDRIQMEINPSDLYTKRDEPELGTEGARSYSQYRRSEPEITYDPDDPLAIAEARRVVEGRRLARAALRTSEEGELTPAEQEVLNQIRISRQQREDPSNRNGMPRTMPRSIHYSELAEESRRANAQQNSVFAQDFPLLARQNMASNTSDTVLPALARQSLALSSSDSSLPTTFRIMQEYMRDRQATTGEAAANTTTSASEATIEAGIADRESRLLSYTPRPRTSTYISARDPPADSAMDTAPMPIPSSLATGSNRVVPSPLDMEARTRASTRNILHTLENLNAAYGGGTTSTPESTAAADLRRRRAIIRARDRAQAPPESGRDRYHRMGAMMRGDYYDPSLGLRTAGLAVSRDGRTLWCACDKGIFEFEINCKERMGLKAVALK